jgi:hypothetical protein
MDDFDKELEELSDAVSKDEELHAAKAQFERSLLWLEHKKFHDEQHTQARLVVWEEALPVQSEPVFREDVAVPQAKHIKVGGCECQPRFAFMEINDQGAVVAGIPAPIEEAKAYSTGEAQPTYGAAGTPVQNAYNGGTNAPKDLYR